MMHKTFLGIYTVALGILFGVVAYAQKPDVSKGESAYKPVATLQELMSSIVDPNVDPIWNSVSTISTKEGTIEKKPQTDEEWLALRKHALTLIEVSNLLVIEGRPVAASGANTSSHVTELSPKDIQKAIHANRDGFVKNAHALQDAAKLTLAAIDAKDADELVKAGGKVEHACEQCHSQFWYPNDKRPTASLDIGLKPGNSLYMKMRNS